MLKNYLITVLRGIWKYKVFSAINIFGLAIGITCCLLILLYVQYEYSYDRYHEKVDRIHRVTLHGVIAGNEINSPTTPYPMAAALMNEFPEVESAVRFRKFFSDTLVSLNEISYQEEQIFHADPSFFEIFSYEFMAGNPQTALAEPNTLVITESTANKYFPTSEALGQTLTFNTDRDYLITGVIEDIPPNSHFHPDFLVSFTSDSNHDSPIWISNNIQTYLLIREGNSAAELETKLEDLIPKYIAPQIEQAIGASLEEFIASGGQYAFALQALADIHLKSQLQGEIEPPGNAAYVYTFQAVAVFILLLACINFMNLSTARSANRAKEIGIRKVMGASREQIAAQFLAESILISLFALLIALPLVALLLPSFNAITAREMSLNILLSIQSLLMMITFVLAVGIVSGAYPALFLSRFHPQEVLKGKYSSGAKSSWLRGTLVVLQFVISVALVAATLIVFSQLDFLRSKPLGFQKEQLLVIHRASALGDQLESYKNQIRQLPNVENAASTTHLPGVGGDQNVFMIAGRPAGETYLMATLTVGYDFIETMGIELVEGRAFSEEFGSGVPGYLVNETAVRELRLEDPTGTNIIEPNPNGQVNGPIIGVVKDFRYLSLHEEIKPMILRIGDFARFVVVRIQANSIQQTIAALEDRWRTMTSGQPFEYSFLEEDFDELHQGDRRMGEIFIGFSVLAILIACLGLYGLAAFSTEQRSKEIGIRKTLGASVSNIVMLISREFVLLVLIAIAIAIPIAYLAMNEWLQLFPYRIEISPLPFLASGVLALIISFTTVSYQSLTAALTNPVLTLRDE